ncbi:MAG: T9SS type A sorting domain-containing protein [Candidatus Omnitrophica bacterium]|nr:T9SS type A sorting domain-containing protein [Candidatus Omnitrophota bacterium]MCG2710997.1 T9SS type A sorting domain-containing protein [Candidatus Omnitrophota bacterium]
MTNNKNMIYRLIRSGVFCLSSICLFTMLARADLTNVFVYPNPFKPSAGHGFATFTNLPQYTSIEVFNTSGVKVRTFWGNLFGNATWDFKNSVEQILPEDVYYAVITDTTTQNSVTLFPMKEVGGQGQTLTRSIPALIPRTETVQNYDVNGNKIGETTLIIKSTATGTVSVVGGARGFVNPANGEKLSIGTKATAAGTIKTSIFDGKGKLVREYSMSTDGTQTTVVQWNGRDSSGRNVSSGVYLIHVEGPGINITKRTVMIK